MEPLEETRTQLVMVTEAVFCSVGNLLTGFQGLPDKVQSPLCTEVAADSRRSQVLTSKTRCCLVAWNGLLRPSCLRGSRLCGMQQAASARAGADEAVSRPAALLLRAAPSRRSQSQEIHDCGPA